MIGFLQGTIISLPTSREIVVNVNGVGYRLFPIQNSFTMGQPVKLFIYTHITDRSMQLYGFQNEAELQLFEDLMLVSGVGPKAALSIISTHGFASVIEAITAGDSVRLKSPGVGKKLISKIILELQDILPKRNYYAKIKNSMSQKTGHSLNIQDEAREALSTLGYAKSEINNAFEKVDMTRTRTTEELLKVLLRLLQS